PKFNMSPEEAKALVDYFAAVEKRFNPDVDLTAPYPKIPQRAPLTSDYWRKKTEEYVLLMKNDKGSQYQQEVEAYKAVWGKMMEDWKTEAKTAAERLKAATEAYEKVKAEDDKIKDDKQKADAKPKLDQAEQNKNFWETEKKRLDDLVAGKTLEGLQEDWSTTEAYALAGFRLVVNQCNKCHAVGNL